MVKKILMAIDRSGYKEKITSFTISLAKALEAEVTAVHVIDKFFFEPTNLMLMVIMWECRLDLKRP